MVDRMERLLAVYWVSEMVVRLVEHWVVYWVVNWVDEKVAGLVV